MEPSPVAARLLGGLELAGLEGLLHRAVGALGVAALVGLVAEFPQAGVEPLLKGLVVAQEPEIAVLHGYDARHALEQVLVEILLQRELVVLGHEVRAHLVDGLGQLADLVVAFHALVLEGLALGDEPGVVYYGVDGPLHQGQEQHGQGGEGDDELDDGQIERVLPALAYELVGPGQGEGQVQHAEYFFPGLVEVAARGLRTALFVQDRGHQPEDALAVLLGVLVDGVGQGGLELGFKALVAGLAQRVLAGDDHMGLLRRGGEHHLSGLVDDADVPDFLELAVVVDDGLDVFAGVEHHGVVAGRASRCWPRGPRP